MFARCRERGREKRKQLGKPGRRSKGGYDRYHITQYAESREGQDWLAQLSVMEHLKRKRGNGAVIGIVESVEANAAKPDPDANGGGRDAVPLEESVKHLQEAADIRDKYPGTNVEKAANLMVTALQNHISGRTAEFSKPSL